ncbi:hypothetical protein FI667_g246, partial [Globisporangium splendens]
MARYITEQFQFLKSYIVIRIPGSSFHSAIPGSTARTSQRPLTIVVKIRGIRKNSKYAHWQKRSPQRDERVLLAAGAVEPEHHEQDDGEPEAEEEDVQHRSARSNADSRLVQVELAISAVFLADQNLRICITLHKCMEMGG